MKNIFKLLSIFALAFAGAAAQTANFTNINVSGTLNLNGNPLGVPSGGLGYGSYLNGDMLYFNSGLGRFSPITTSSSTNQIMIGGGPPSFSSTIPTAVQNNITTLASTGNFVAHSFSAGVAGLQNSGDFSGQHFVPTTDNGSGFQVGAQTFRFNLGFFGQGGVVIGGDGTSNNGARITASGTAPNETLVLRGHGTAGVDVGTVTAGTWNGTAIGASYLPTATSGALGIVRPDNTTISVSGGVITALSGAGTVTSLSAGTGITLAPNPIVSTGTISISSPVSVANGGTGTSTFSVGGILLGNGTSPVTNSATNLFGDSSGNIHMAGNLTFSTDTNGELGGTSTTVPSAGVVTYSSGQGLSNGSAVILTSNVTANLIDKTMPAGHFLVWGTVWYNLGAGASVSVYAAATSTSTATLPGVNTNAQSQTTAPIAGVGTDGNLVIAPHYYTSNTSWHLYLVSAYAGSGGTVSSYGGLSFLQLR